MANHRLTGRRLYLTFTVSFGTTRYKSTFLADLYKPAGPPGRRQPTIRNFGHSGKAPTIRPAFTLGRPLIGARRPRFMAVPTD